MWGKSCRLREPAWLVHLSLDMLQHRGGESRGHWDQVCRGGGSMLGSSSVAGSKAPLWIPLGPPLQRGPGPALAGR